MAWQRLIEHFEPTAKTRQAGQLLALLSWNFAHGDIQNQMELFDAAAHKYEVRSADTLSDAMRIGIALRQMEDGPLRQHLLLNGGRLAVWKDFKSEITDVLRAIAAVGPTPMDVSAVYKGGKATGKGGRWQIDHHEGDLPKLRQSWALRQGVLGPRWRRSRT